MSRRNGISDTPTAGNSPETPSLADPPIASFSSRQGPPAARFAGMNPSAGYPIYGNDAWADRNAVGRSAVWLTSGSCFREKQWRINKVELKTFIAPLMGLAVLIFGGGAALAASPTYCALYAKEFVKHATVDSQGPVPTDRTHDRAYHKCLNMDDEPVLPTAYFDADGEGAGEVGGPFVADENKTDIGTGDGDLGGGAMASFETGPKPATREQPTTEWVGVGLPAGSPELRAWCEEHYPNSYDPDTGTVVPYDTGVRTACR